MKKLISFSIVALFLIIPLSSLASSGLGMNISQFIDSYNQVPAYLGSPYNNLSSPDEWAPLDGRETAYFYADNKKSVAIGLSTCDGRQGDLSSPIESVIIITFDKINIPCFLSVADRVLTVFLDNHLTIKQSSKCLLEAQKKYFELKVPESDMSSVELFGSVCLYYSQGKEFCSYIIH